MKTQLLIASGFFFCFLSMPASYSSEKPPVATIARIPDICLWLIRRLDKEPLFDGKGTDLSPSSKVLPIANQTLWQIFCFFNNCSGQIPGVGRTFINKFTLENMFFSKTGVWLSQGIYAQSPINHEGYRQLATVWRDMVDHLSFGWRVTPMEIFSNLEMRKFLSSWYLLVKPQEDFNDEVVLLRHLSSIMGVKSSVRCFGQEQGNPSLYLWIKHDAFGRVVKAFNLKIVS